MSTTTARPMPTATHFAAVSPADDLIYGVATTPLHATLDAADWSSGDMRTVPCTAALAARVTEHGGTTPYATVAGILCTPEEAEAYHLAEF